MPSHYNFSPEQRAYKNPLMAGNLLSRIDHISFGPEYLKSVLDPDMLKEAEAYIANIASQNDGTMQEISDPSENHDLRPEAAIVAGTAVVEASVPEAPVDSEGLDLLSEAESYSDVSEPAYVGDMLEDNLGPQDDYELAA